MEVFVIMAMVVPVDMTIFLIGLVIVSIFLVVSMSMVMVVRDIVQLSRLIVMILVVIMVMVIRSIVRMSRVIVMLMLMVVMMLMITIMFETVIIFNFFPSPGVSVNGVDPHLRHPCYFDGDAHAHGFDRCHDGHGHP